MLKSLGENSQGKNFRTGQRLIARGSIGQDTGQINNFCQPSAIFLSLEFDAEIHLVLFDICLRCAYRNCNSWCESGTAE